MKPLAFIYEGARAWLGEVSEEAPGRVTLADAVEWHRAAVPMLNQQTMAVTTAFGITVRTIEGLTSLPKITIHGAYTRVDLAEFNETDQTTIRDAYEQTEKLAPKARMHDGNAPRLILPGRGLQ